ncbi:DHS-like NAD/FAD-binding domain-containing protein [Lipomyces arxii]|uniref:DHS-like NAD/FAD-binding domain-containing protein n=1 Tax=Lipomyces arxii TaxID=56418 RepID=UPI0034CE2ABF
MSKKLPGTGKPTLASVAQYLKSGDVRNVVVMVGAGISTSAGIPDFRSPNTGLYHNLSRLKLPYAEAVFDIAYFRKRPEAFYTLAHELYPGKFRPTLFHSFLKVLDDQGVLRRVYTQNIDTLERIAGVPSEKIVEAHGSFAENHCIDCGKAMSTEDLEKFMAKDKIPHCKKCGGLVKPDIVFFGENLPARFFKLMTGDLASADLVIVAGTSLQVHPFASLPSQTSCPRVLFNLESVGDIGRRKSDVVCLGPCDDGVRDLAFECGWLPDLEALWAKTTKDGVTPEKEDVLHAIDKAAAEEVAKEEAEGANSATEIAPEISRKDVEDVVAAIEELEISKSESMSSKGEKDTMTVQDEKAKV